MSISPYRFILLQRVQVLYDRSIEFFESSTILQTQNRAQIRHVFANRPECHILASYQMWFAKNCSKNSRKSQKSPIFDKKCSCLVMLSSGSTEIWFQPELPGLYILHQEMVIFGIFSKNFVTYPPTTSGSLPKCDILEG